MRKSADSSGHCQSFTHALYPLAANPEYARILREEVESVVATDGWTKLAMGKMHKVDSFLRESQRFDGLGVCPSLLSPLSASALIFSTDTHTVSSDHATLRSEALHLLEWSDGPCRDAAVLHVHVSAPRRRKLHERGRIRPMAIFRHARGRGRSSQAPNGLDRTGIPRVRTRQARLVRARISHLASATRGTDRARRASPGRFFAANELKAMLAHVVVTYDVRFEDGRAPPPNLYVGSACVPGKAHVLFRKRQV